MSRKPEVGVGASAVVPKKTLRAEVGQSVDAVRTLFGLFSQPRVLLTFLMVVLLIGSAMSVVYVTHWNRQLFVELRALQDQRDGFEREWSQLLLEQGAWGAHGRVERVATTEMNMKVVSPEDFRLVK